MVKTTVIAGGSGQLGALLAKSLRESGQRVRILTRSPRDADDVAWDGKTLGPWAAELEGADALVNLTGRSVNCRYTEENLREMLDSRVDSTRVLGEAIRAAKHPPRVWLQMSTATLYAHTLGEPHDELSTRFGGSEPNVPAYWRRSIEIAQAWERALEQAQTPQTRKVVLRTAMVMSPGAGGVFDVLLRLTRFGLGGAVAGGEQFISWIHGEDFTRAVRLLLDREDLRGVFNLAAPAPLPQREFMRALREAYGRRLGLPATELMLKLGAWALRTDTELLMKSRRVVSTRLPQAGFRFEFPDWPSAARALVAQWRALDLAPSGPRTTTCKL